MMPITGTPIIVHLMKIFAQQGFTEFVLAAGHRKEIIQDYFDGRFKEWDIDIVDTGADSDTGERIRRCLPYTDGTFLATYGDGLGNVNLRRLLEFHREAKGAATVTAVPLRSQYGALHMDPASRVTRFEEKPIIADYWINAGFFVFEPEVFLQQDGQNLESDILPEVAKRNQLFAYRHMGFWKSMDTSKDQQEMERINNGHSPSAPWNQFEDVMAASAR